MKCGDSCEVVNNNNKQDLEVVNSFFNCWRMPHRAMALAAAMVGGLV